MAKIIVRSTKRTFTKNRGKSKGTLVRKRNTVRVRSKRK